MTRHRTKLPPTAIRLRTLEMGMTMNELARRLEITPKQLGDIARGRVRVRRVVAAKAAQILNRKVVDLFPPEALLPVEESKKVAGRVSAAKRKLRKEPDYDQ